jgi:hypothetical protein
MPLIVKSIKPEYPTVNHMDGIEMNEAYLVHEIAGETFPACPFSPERARQESHPTFRLQVNGSSGLLFSEADGGHVLEFVARLEHSKVDPKTPLKIGSRSILTKAYQKYNDIGNR